MKTFVLVLNDAVAIGPFQDYAAAKAAYLELKALDNAATRVNRYNLVPCYPAGGVTETILEETV